MPLVAGVDSSTQSCKVVIRDADTGALVRQGRAAHPEGTEVHPDHWWTALQKAAADAGGLDDVSALSVGGQQHGMVCLDSDGAVIRPALLWNDTRSAGAAVELIKSAGGGDIAAGAKYWAKATGTVPVASLTLTKLRWLAENEPENAAKVAAVCLPHDWLTWRLAGYGPGTGQEGLKALVTDRSDASGTGYYSTAAGQYLPALLVASLGRTPILPKVLEPLGTAGTTPDGVLLAAGAGDNAAAALGAGARPGDVVISLGTSGTVFAVSDTPAADPSGLVAGFADATGHYLPLVCTLNATRVFDATAKLLGVSLHEFHSLALSAAPGAGGLTMVPYLDGERTPNLPDATGSLHGITRANYTPANLARAAVEGVVCSLADGLAALQNQGVNPKRIILVGGGAQSAAVQEVAVRLFGVNITVLEPGEYVADGAARQAAAALTGAFPDWPLKSLEREAEPDSGTVLGRYRSFAALHLPQQAGASS